MRTKVTPIESLKALFTEIFFNKQNKVTKISNQSVFNGFSFGMSRATQKTAKDIAIIESKIFPQYATGTNLDESAAMFASLDRNTVSGSSTYVLIIAEPGTTYPQATTSFTSTAGIEFELTEDFTVDDNGLGYAKVRSTTDGKRSNVDPNTIVKVSPKPAGHIAVTNEFKATGGRDAETDEDFRNRIFQHPNVVAQKTLAFLAETFRLFNEDVLFLQNIGFDEDGFLNLSVVQQNGQDQTVGELASLLDDAQGYFALTDINRVGSDLGIKLVNPSWYDVGGTDGIDFRVSLFDNFDTDQVRKNIQIQMARYFDLRYWSADKKVIWADLLVIVKQTEGVKSVPDDFFRPRVDEEVPVNELPRIKGFVMRDLSGNIISDNNGILTPIFYPAG